MGIFLGVPYPISVILHWIESVVRTLGPSRLKHGISCCLMHLVILTWWQYTGLLFDYYLSHKHSNRWMYTMKTDEFFIYWINKLVLYETEVISSPMIYLSFPIEIYLFTYYFRSYPVDDYLPYPCYRHTWSNLVIDKLFLPFSSTEGNGNVQLAYTWVHHLTAKLLAKPHEPP